MQHNALILVVILKSMQMHAYCVRPHVPLTDQIPKLICIGKKQSGQFNAIARHLRAWGATKKGTGGEIFE